MTESRMSFGTMIVLDDDSLVAIAGPEDSDDHNVIVRFDVSGTLMSSTALASYGDAMLRDPAGRFMVYGTRRNGTFEVARLLPDGQLDTAFGTAGIARFSFEWTRVVLLDPEGGLLVIGERELEASKRRGFRPTEGVILRIDDRGKLRNPVVAFTLLPGIDSAIKGATSTRDGIVVSGHAGEDAPLVYVTRVSAFGVTDPTFGDAGFGYARGPTFSAAYAFTVDAKGRFVVGGMHVEAVARGPIVLARFTPGGQLDDTFANHGTWLGKDGKGDADNVAELIANSDGGITVVGISQNWDTSTTRTMLARFDDRGQPSSKVQSASDNWTVDQAVVDHQGRVIVVGSVGAGWDDNGKSLGNLSVIERYAPN